MQLRKAQRSKAKIRLGLSGPSGSGKTYSALLIAYGITSDWDKVVLIDTENGSADLYAHLGPFNVLQLNAPYTPERYIEAIATAEKSGAGVIIVDSITHEWNGKGGCLDEHEKIVSRMKIPNSYTAWKDITPRHQSFIDAILQSNCHIITTVRSKTDYVLTERNGKQVPQKVGMAAQTREGFEYELTVSLDVDLQHAGHASKDRTGLFMDKAPMVLTSQTGEMILAWCESGADVVEETIAKISRQESQDDLKELWSILDPMVKKEQKVIDAKDERKAALSKLQLQT